MSTAVTPAQEQAVAAPDTEDARLWVRILANYREPSHARSVFELFVTLIPFLAIWALALWCLSFSYLLAAALSIFNGLFLVRLFVIQHDCGHGSFFRNRLLNDWIGRALGVVTVTPYDVWRRTHAVHHASAGNLDKRGMGDVMTLTVSEYQNLSRFGQLKYRLYRNPFVLFVLGPSYLFFLENRLPLGLMRAGWRYWVSAMGTNVVLAVVLGGLVYFVGLAAILLVFAVFFLTEL